MKIRFRRLPQANGLPSPETATSGSAGFDLRAAVQATETLAPGQRRLIPTGLVLELPPGWEGQVRPRSGLALHHGVTVVNAPGTIDSDYRGEVGVILINHGLEAFSVERGDRIAQLVVAAVPEIEWKEVEALEGSERGAGGFGSTGTE
ncbi:MAG: dUTP diphosphatase [Deltaproteobacteria bacterium]|nr:dUTP diphosphatase [Deltaproteobacteria bacterium]